MEKILMYDEYGANTYIELWGTLHNSGSNHSLTDTRVAAVVVASGFQNFVHRCLRVLTKHPHFNARVAHNATSFLLV
jgi:hypothetical protein